MARGLRSPVASPLPPAAAACVVCRVLPGEASFLLGSAGLQLLHGASSAGHSLQVFADGPWLSCSADA